MRVTRISILSATYNARACVQLMCASLRRYTPEPFVMLVADNGSTDGTLADLQALPWVNVYETESDHGGALDALVQRVETEWFVTLDSDVEFLNSGWLTELVGQDVDAVGEFERAIGAYRSRLAPHLLLLRTSAFRTLETSFREYVYFTDQSESARWRAGSPRAALTPEEVATYRHGHFYPTGAAVFEALVQRNMRWAETPSHVREKYAHLGHMSWSAAAPKLEYVQRRLAEV